MSQAGIPTLEIPICYNVFPCSPGLYHDGEQWSMVRKMIRYLLRHEQDKEVIRTALDHLALFLTPSDKSSVPQYAAEMVQRILKETNTATDHVWYTKFTNLRENSEAKILEPYLEQLNEELWLRFSRIPLRDWIRLTLTNIQSSSVFALIDGLEHIRNSLSRSTESYLLNVRSRKPNFLMNACLSKEYTWQDALSPLRRGIEETVCHVEIAKGTSERPRTPAVDFSVQLRVFLSRLEILKLRLHRLRASRNTSSWRRLNDVYWLPLPHPAAMFGILDIQQHHKKTYLIRNDLVKLAVAEEIVRNLSQRVVEIMTVEPDTVKCLENLLEVCHETPFGFTLDTKWLRRIDDRPRRQRARSSCYLRRT